MIMGVYERYQSRFNNSGGNYRSGLTKMTVGEKVKIDSDMVMNETWWNDPQSQVAYLYDWYHDDYKTQLKNMRPELDKKKIPVDIKFIVDPHQSMDKDVVTKHLEFRPQQKCVVDYYDEMFGDRYDAIYPCGLYVDIIDEQGKYNRWLVVALADYYTPQFPKYQILPCDHILQYVYKGNKYNVACVGRSQNSYVLCASYGKLYVESSLIAGKTC